MNEQQLENYKNKLNEYEFIHCRRPQIIFRHNGFRDQEIRITEAD